MKKTVQLLGGHYSVIRAPIIGAERWSVNGLHFNFRTTPLEDSWTRWFDLHPLPYIKSSRPHAYAWYREQTKPIYLIEPDPSIPAAIVYPRAEIQEAFASNGTPENFFNSSMDWMMALAIHEGFECIQLWGYRMDRGEYHYQHPGMHYWIGMARGRGIEVTYPPISLFCHTNEGKLYGFETHS
jgi:hypothetical protein